MMVGHWSGGLEGGQKLHIISRGCAGVQQGLAQLQGRGGFQVCSNKNELWSVLYYTTYGRGKMSDWIQPCTVWLRPTWNWWYFRRPRSPTASTRGVGQIKHYCSWCTKKTPGWIISLYHKCTILKVEANQNFGPNVVRCQLASGGWRWYIVGFYLEPDDISTT